MEPVRVGVVGCGDVAPIYLESMRRFPMLSCIAVADRYPPRAAALAAAHGVRWVGGAGRLCEDPAVELVVNLTPPRAHADVTRRAIAAEKHVYSEKPLAESPWRARELLAAADAAGVRVGCAPATWLGGAWQTSRAMLDAGAIGRPVGAAGTCLGPGYTSWHPRPRPYFAPGGGPLLDIGPYYVAALVFLLGAVVRVSGSAVVAVPERVVGAGSQRGRRFPVTTADYAAGVLQFANGTLATLAVSYAVPAAPLEPLRLSGTRGTLVLPAANRLGGPVWLHRTDRGGWQRCSQAYPRRSQAAAWASGVAEMADAIRSGRDHRAGGLLGLHVVEVLAGLLAAASDGHSRAPSSRPARPAPLAPGTRNEVFA